MCDHGGIGAAGGPVRVATTPAPFNRSDTAAPRSQPFSLPAVRRFLVPSVFRKYFSFRRSRYGSYGGGGRRGYYGRQTYRRVRGIRVSPASPEVVFLSSSYYDHSGWVPNGTVRYGAAGDVLRTAPLS